MPSDLNLAAEAEPTPKRILILGGTTEGAALARTLADRFGPDVDVITSLAGRTERPGALPGLVRIGGFGGAEGLAAYLAETGIDLLIDATHPFANQISTNAAKAAEAADVPRLMVIRPPWTRSPLDRWVEVGDVAGAVDVLPRVGKRAFLTLGSGEIDAFAPLGDTFFLVRMIDAPKVPLPLAQHEVVLDRGPFTMAGELHLLRRFQIDVIVSKASGGAATEAKLLAAREADIPLVMIRRPVPPPGTRVDTVEEALDWITRRL